MAVSFLRGEEREREERVEKRGGDPEFWAKRAWRGMLASQPSPGGGGAACSVETFFLGSFSASAAQASAGVDLGNGEAGLPQALAGSSCELVLVAVVAELSRRTSVA